MPSMRVLTIGYQAREVCVVRRAPLIRPSATFSPLRGEKELIRAATFGQQKSRSMRFGFFGTALDHRVVERRGIEPLTSTMRTWRSPS